jgi:hypothetical protein
MELNLERVRANVVAADTEDLLDRATIYRAEMEPLALEIVEEELWRRGITANDREAHDEVRRQTALTRPDGTVVKCDDCHRPAVVSRWGWHRFWGRWPLFPRMVSFCADHRPDQNDAEEPLSSTS